MEDDSLFIIDTGIIKALLSDTDSNQTLAIKFFDYLSWRNKNKKAVMLPREFNELIERICINQDELAYQEGLAYFKNYILTGEILGTWIGKSKTEEFISLVKNLAMVHKKIIVISESLKNNDDFKNNIGSNVLVFGNDDLLSYLTSKKDFFKYMASYYESSA